MFRGDVVASAPAEVSKHQTSYLPSALTETTMTSDSGLPVETALRLPPLHHGRIVAGHGGVLTRHVRWVAVMEGPVEDFVAPGEFVLTIGAGYDTAGFERFAGEIAEAGAAALCVSVGHGAPFACVPPGVVELGDSLQFPIIELPWEIRFADVLRALADRLLADRYAALPADDQLSAGLTAALLRRDGLTAVTEAAETMIGKPVVILDAALEPLATGPRANALVSPGLLAERVADMSSEARQHLRAHLESEDVVALPKVEPLGLPAVLATTARAQDRSLGYVLGIGDGRQANAFAVERRALQHAGAAVAIELLRRQAAAEAEARVHGDFIWELAGGQLSPQEVAAKATLLGYSLGHNYQLILARCELPQQTSVLDDVVRETQRRGVVEGVHATRSGREAMILVPVDAPSMLAPTNLIRRLMERLDEATLTWGVADRHVTLRTLADGLSRARRAAEIGHALHGSGAIGDAKALEPFFMLANLARDPEAARIATELLEPLVQYDACSSSELLRTLEIYLEELGNTSSAARRLYLNRHSLIYRLHKVEALTGRDLGKPEDRLILDISLRIRRLASSASLA